MDFFSRVDPQLREGLEKIPTLKLPEDLSMARQFTPPPWEKSDAVRMTERYIAGPDGNEMLLKIYEPSTRDASSLPALLWIHGGGYVLGHPSGDDNLCQQFVMAAGCVVVSPDYRLAPDHPYPAAIEDCYTSLVWLANVVDELNIDRTRIAIGGASAGGGLAAALALLARDRGGPEICFQMPLYPMIDDRNETPSSHEITNPIVWNRANNVAAWKLYLGELADGDIPAYAAASRATDLAGLPPTYTCVGQLDPFRDETIEYVARLAQAGVAVEFHLHPGGFHGFENVAPEAGVSKRAREGYLGALSRALT